MHRTTPRILRAIRIPFNLRNRSIAVLLALAVALVTVTPSQSFAQSQAATSNEPNSETTQARPAPELTRSLAAEVAKVTRGPLTKEDLKRIEQQPNQQSSAPPSSHWTRKNKILIALFIVVVTGAVVVAIKHRCKAPNPCPVSDDTDYDDY